ncbi:response regulator [Magnetovibrio sp. PR-2]|uniref:response regulator n=1 Tax=Magnetovibrio sp. PR-2 TaxID=3120356 RepID=UPI002FCE525E
MTFKTYNIQNVNVLVVDDDIHSRQIVKGILWALGVRDVREAKDGAEALRILQTFAADIVFCDWNMCPIDGLEFTRLVRTSTDSPNPFVNIVMLTAHREFKHVIEARDAGINEYLIKPVSPKSLYARICAVIDNPRPYVRCFGDGEYFGPTRRRHDSELYADAERRHSAPVEVARQSLGYA